MHYLPEKLRLWFWLFLTTAAFFTVLRLLFMLTHLVLIGDTGFPTLLHSFWIGFRYDAVILSVVTLPLYSAYLLPFILPSRRAWRLATATVLTVLFAPMFLLSLADIRFFDQFGSRLNYWAVEYIEYPKMFLYTVLSTSGAWLLLLIGLILTAAYFLLCRNIIKRVASLPPGRHRKSFPVYLRVAFHLLAIVLLSFGIRGRIGIKPIDWGEAFFCDNQFINQLALNSIYTLAHSVYEERQDGTNIDGDRRNRFDFYDIDLAGTTVRKMLGIEQAPQPGDYILRYRTEPSGDFGFAPNIVLVIMESWSADKIGELGSDLNISPEFDRLCDNGWLFNRFYANGIRTNRGLAATLCSFPSLPGRSIMKRYSAAYPFRSLADILGEQGYRSTFVYGGDIQFDNMKGFLTAVGFDDFLDEADFPGAMNLGRWGVADHALFDNLSRRIENFRRPFLLTVMTLSFHDPYLIPDDRFEKNDPATLEGRRNNCFYYSDWAIGRFIDSMKARPVFDSTIFVFTADHCEHQTAEYPLDPRAFHIPLLIYAPAFLGEARRIFITGSQVDIIPTLVGLTGLETEIYGWGRDLLNLPDNDPGFAVMVAGDRLGIVEDSLFYMHWVGPPQKRLYNLYERPYLENDLRDERPATAARLERELHSYIQLAHTLSRGRINISLNK